MVIYVLLATRGYDEESWSELTVEPPRQLAPQSLLVVIGPRHVAVRPQQHGGHVQFLANFDDVVDPIRPACHREPAGSVEQQSAAAVRQLVKAPRFSPPSRILRPSSSCPPPRS